MGPSSFLCTIVPPHILDRLARNADPALAGPAQRTLVRDAQERSRRRVTTEFGLAAAPIAKAPSDQPLRTIYDAEHGSALPGIKVRGEGSRPGKDVTVNRAYAGLGATFDLFLKAYQRHSIDGNGLPLDATVHYDRDYNNAFWNGEQMVFGDGDGEIFLDFTIPIDVIGHELTHGVTQYTANLAYFGQPGALNESMSDVFGSLIKQYTLGQTAAEADWLIGAGLLAPSVTGKALRSMKEPGTAYDDDVLGKDPQPATMDDYVRTGRDNGGVHINSGIPNHAFYLVAEALGEYAWERAGQIWYDVLTGGQLQPQADFSDFARLTAAAARSRYGEGEESQSVLKAWEQVGVGTSMGSSSVGWRAQFRLDREAFRGGAVSEQVLTESFGDALHEQWRRHRRLESHGSSLDQAVVRTIGADAAALAMSNLSWHLALGECIGAQSLASQLGRGAHDIVQEVESGHLVGLVGRHEAFLPLWQFRDHVPGDHPIPQVVRVLEVFRTGLGAAFSPELVVLWAATEQPELQDQEPRAVFTEVPAAALEWSARVTVSGLAQ
ncbi:hypothetical protein QFZ24_010097 [Streptomyces phaeochromogenes]|nr:hypothetical protein [Streptomyces phaeochromogenes]